MFQRVNYRGLFASNIKNKHDYADDSGLTYTVSMGIGNKKVHHGGTEITE